MPKNLTDVFESSLFFYYVETLIQRAKALKQIAVALKFLVKAL